MRSDLDDCSTVKQATLLKSLLYIRAPQVCQEQILPHLYISTTSLDCSHNAGWVHGFMLVMPNAEPTICMPQQKIHQPIFSESIPTAASHFSYWLKEWNPKRSSAVVAHLDLRLDMLCILRCFSAHHYYKEYLSELLLPFRLPNSLAILLE